MTTELDKMQAQVRLPWVPIPLAAQSILQYKHSSDGWMTLAYNALACLLPASNRLH